MIRLLLISCTCLWYLAAETLEARPVVVRSGAHDGFTRLVLDVSPGQEWSLETANRSARVTLEGHQDGFDLVSVFDRIDKTHVSRVESGSAAVDFFFPCDCIVSAFQQGAEMIVLDVSASIEADQNDFLEDNPQPPFQTIAPRFKFGQLGTEDSSWSKNSMPTNLAESELTDRENTNEAVSERIPLSENGLADAQANIAKQVGLAASRGLLKLKTRQIDLPIVRNRPQIDTQVFDSSRVLISIETSQTPGPASNLRITSSSDIALGLDAPVASTTLGVRCISPSTTAIADWTTGQDFSLQISERRNELYSEFDRLDPDAAIRLARTYLHYGFGAEVRGVLALDPDLVRNNPALLEMAEIMEYGHSRQPSYLPNFMECDTDVSLWAILSQESIAPETPINTNAALRAVTSLPMHLRSFIAPELSRRLLEYGEPDSSAAALRSLERATQHLSARADLAKADLEMADGNLENAQKRLERVLASNVEQSAEALIKYVDLRLEEDGLIEQDVATLVEAYALEMRDEPIGLELKRTYILALAKSGQFDAAFDALARAQDRRDAEISEEVRATLWDILTRNASEIEFLEQIFSPNSALERLANEQTRVRLASRLADLGFAAEAELTLAPLANIQNDEATRLIRAKIALALSRPFEAEALIFGIQTPEAKTLRAEAKSRSGGFDEAHVLFSQVGEMESINRSAWLSENWASLVSESAPVLGEVARISRTILDDDPRVEGMLSRTSSTLDESAIARSVISDLLRLANAEDESEW